MRDGMKKMMDAMTAVALGATLSATALQAQETRQDAVSGLRQVKPEEMDASYKTPAPLAQKIVDEVLAAHPEILLMAIHAAPPGHKNLIVASNFGRIGKIGDEDDMRCIHTGKPNLEISEKGNHFEDEMVLQDKAGKTVGAIAFVYAYKPGVDKEALAKQATAIRDGLKAEIPTSGALFK
jgi:iron complex outermembrane receptor protein